MSLVTLPGVGRKTANVVLGHAFGVPGITVDTHVGRLARRMGFTTSEDPVKVEADLAELVPRKEWTIMSDRLIFHGRRVCHSRKPACGACGVAVTARPSASGPTDPQVAEKLVRRRRGDGPLSVIRSSRTGPGDRPARAPLPEPAPAGRPAPRRSAPKRSPASCPRRHGGRPAAVLMLFATGPDGPDVLIIERAAGAALARRASRPFRAARSTPRTTGPSAAALREAAEEVGLDPGSVEVIAELPDLFIPVTGFVVTPVLAWWREPHAVRSGRHR